MARKRFSAEQIISKLRAAEVVQANGQPIQEACRQIGVTEQTYYRWRKEYGGFRVDPAKPLKGRRVPRHLLQALMRPQSA